MTNEESKLVDQVEETTESNETETIKDEFNPLAFAEDVYNETEETEESEESEGEVTEEDENKFSWEQKAKPEESEEKNEEDYDWDGAKENEEALKSDAENTVTDLNWEEISKQLGVMAKSKDELVGAINAYVNQQQQPDPQTSQSQELKKYLSFSDRKLVAEELKADGLDASEIEDSLDKLEDSGMLKMKAKSVRRVINNAIDSQVEQEKHRIATENNNRTVSANKARQDLQVHIKDMDNFMGGKVTKKQKEEVYRYATSKMSEDIWKDHANVADVAMFMLYKDQITNILRSQGLADGKAAMMNSIVSPNLNTGKSKSDYKVKSGKFDPKAFMGQ
tara:strand:+ start:1394 stop:2398 length:1005 start_codon:yes stop_codon:yes gene_type:complete